jgi:hypothetical protein
MVGSGAFKEMNIKITVICYPMSSILIYLLTFRTNILEKDEICKFLRNVGTYLQNFTMLHPERSQY